MRGKALAAAALCASALLAAAGCGGSDNGSGGGGGGTIKIGASLPLSGPLAGFGSFVKWGYQHAVDEVNAAGGITVDGEKKKVRLVLLDDKTDPNTVANNTTRLITRDKSTRCSARARPRSSTPARSWPTATACRSSPAATRSRRSSRSSRSGTTSGTCSSTSPSSPRCRSRR
jgi:hypothetical protein